MFSKIKTREYKFTLTYITEHTFLLGKHKKNIYFYCTFWYTDITHILLKFHIIALKYLLKYFVKNKDY